MLEPRKWLKTIGTLSIGGAIGASLGALIYLLLRSYLEGVSIYEVMALLAAIGAGVQRILQRAGWFLGFFEQLYELGSNVHYYLRSVKLESISRLKNIRQLRREAT